MQYSEWKKTRSLIDGTHQSLALYAIRMEDGGLLERLLQRSAPVKHCRMISSNLESYFMKMNEEEEE
jgi:hypothetical protein